MKCIQKELILEDDLFKSTKLEKDILIRVSDSHQSWSISLGWESILCESSLLFPIWHKDHLHYGIRERWRSFHASFHGWDILRIGSKVSGCIACISYWLLTRYECDIQRSETWEHLVEWGRLHQACGLWYLQVVRCWGSWKDLLC